MNLVRSGFQPSEALETTWAEYLLLMLANEEPPEPPVLVDSVEDFAEQMAKMGW